jgi:competence CoiA-like predicted nuclease
MGIKRPTAWDKTNNKIIRLDDLRDNPARQKEVENFELWCNCGKNCGIRIHLVSINSLFKEPYFSPLFKGGVDCTHEGKSETHLNLEAMMEDKWGAKLPDYDHGIWKNEPRPDGVMESEKIVIEIERFRHRNWESVVERNKVYREKGYTPFWIIYGREWEDFADKEMDGGLKSFSISDLTSLEFGIYADCGFLHYYIDGATPFITNAIFKAGELRITHPNNWAVNHKDNWHKLLNSINDNPISKIKTWGRWKNGYDVVKDFEGYNEKEIIVYGGKF